MYPLYRSITLFPPDYSTSISVHILAPLGDFRSHSSKYVDITIQAEAAVITCSPWTLCNLDIALCIEGLRSCSSASSIL